jgi:hypothetical protein
VYCCRSASQRRYCSLFDFFSKLTRHPFLAVAAIPAAYALKAKDVLTGALAALGASNLTGKAQLAPTVNNGDIVITTTSMFNGGGRGKVHTNVVIIHQSID